MGQTKNSPDEKRLKFYLFIIRDRLAKHARVLQLEKNYYMLMANNNRNKTFIYVGASLYSRPHCKM